MGFFCAPPRVWPSPESRGDWCRGAIAAVRGRVPGRGLQREATAAVAGASFGAWDWGTASEFTVSWAGELGLVGKAGVRREARAGAGAVGLVVGEARDAVCSELEWKYNSRSCARV